MNNLIWLEHIGLCEGVRSAIWSTISSVEKEKQVVIFGNLIHNQRVQQELNWNGIKTVYCLEDIPDHVRIIIPAHGVTKEIETKLRQITNDVVDRTCAVVIKLRKLLMNVSKSHDHVILVGKKNHPEIVGAISYVDNNKVIIVEDAEQIKKIAIPKGSIALLSQTTASTTTFNKIEIFLRGMLNENELTVHETICPTVAKRQKDVVEFSKKSDMVFVVGDAKSSNTYSLYESAKPLNEHTYLIQSDGEKCFSDKGLTALKKASTIAILSGTSSPTYIIDEIVHRIKKSLNLSLATSLPVLAIYGPTAIGKSELSETIAKNRKADIINVDSMQIYKHLTVGTAKPSLSDPDLSYYLVDMVDPSQYYSVARFRKEAEGILKQNAIKDRLTILAGGSSLYLASIIDGLFECFDVIDPKIRVALKKRIESEGLASLHSQLLEMDSTCAHKIHPNDEKRIIRALEVILSTNKKMSEWQKVETLPLPYFYIKIGLIQPLDLLYEKIHHRVDQMLSNGLLTEIDFLLANGYEDDLERIKAHGYREMMWHLQGKISLDEAKEIMTKNTRNYAKRQLSWLRQRSDFHLINTSIKTNNEWADIIMDIYFQISEKISPAL